MNHDERHGATWRSPCYTTETRSNARDRRSAIRLGRRGCMPDLHQALAEIKQIRTQVARDTQFRGYGPASITASGVLALLVAAGQAHWMRNRTDFTAFGAVWFATALPSIAMVA